MEFHLVPIFALLCLLMVGSNASLPAEEYWQSVLPNTPMPKFLLDLVQLGQKNEKDYGFDSIDIIDARKKYKRYGLDSADDIDARKKYKRYGLDSADDTDARKKYKRYGLDSTDVIDARKKYKRYGVDSTDVIDARKKYKRYGVENNEAGFDNSEVAKELAQYKKSNTTVFLLYNDLHAGKTMRLLFSNAANKVGFLPRQVAESIPFSSKKLPEIFNRFSIEPKSVEAKIMKESIEECEEKPSMEDENKFCATSLESLIDLNVARLGTQVRVVSTEAESKKQDYTILGEVKKVGDKATVCHKQKYTYAVFYCHSDHTTDAYMVPLVGADGIKAKALVVCHKDTSDWSPNHLAFLVLKVKPGPPICHFLASDTVVWAPTKNMG